RFRPRSSPAPTRSSSETTQPPKAYWRRIGRAANTARAAEADAGDRLYRRLCTQHECGDRVGAGCFSAGTERNALRRGSKRNDRIWPGEGHLDRLPAVAADLVSRKVDVIMTQGGDSATSAAQQATSTIPILFHTNNDPVAAGYVASLA